MTICIVSITESFCGKSDIVLTPGSSQNLTSFEYPGKNRYQGPHDCKWTVSAPAGMHVRVQFLDMQLFPVFDGLMLDKKTFSTMPTTDYVSEGNILEIIYFTFGAHPLSMGFHIVLSAYLPEGEL